MSDVLRLMLNVGLTGNIASGKSTEFDVVVLVDAPVALRRTRLRAMRGLGNEEADRMIAAQMPAERKRGRSHYVIDNKGTLEELEADARRLYDVLAARAKQLP